eukprot:346090-Chlamydomonas_euryale.AAC.8
MQGATSARHMRNGHVCEGHIHDAYVLVAVLGLDCFPAADCSRPIMVKTSAENTVWKAATTVLFAKNV